MGNRWMMVVALGAALVLGGCGTGEPGGGGGSALSDLSSEEIVASAREAYLAATSVRIKGTLATEGQEASLDLRLTQGGDGQIAVTSGGIGLELIRLGDQTWFRSPDAFTQISPEVAAAVGDRWVLVTPGSNSAQLVGATESFIDMGTFGEQILTGLESLEKVEGETVGGVPTVGLRDGAGITMHVAAEGEPYPLLVTPPADQDQSKRLEFSGYNEDPGITAPQDPVNDVEELIAGTLLGG